MKTFVGFYMCKVMEKIHQHDKQNKKKLSSPYCSLLPRHGYADMRNVPTDLTGIDVGPVLYQDIVDSQSSLDRCPHHKMHPDVPTYFCKLKR